MNCVHLDFHTSPDIEGIGKDFNKEEFTKTLKEAHVDLMTVFAKCHHSYTYYPSKVAAMHPHLDFNLLQAEIDAIHAAGAKAPIYITMGWSHKDSIDHPQWRVVDFDTRDYVGRPAPQNPDAPYADGGWTRLCPVGDYFNHLKAITHEVCQNFDISDGIFFDICLVGKTCVCEACKAGMKERGLNHEVRADVEKYFTDKRIEMMATLNGIIHSYNKNATIFYNSGGANMARPEFHPYQTHYEMEDLPTAWGGYDLMPLRAKYFERYGKFFLGMTGKFHHCWGEFGGFKNKEALRYECADMLSVGASISVGDHLHPSGKLDRSTYELIGHSFKYADSIKEYCENTRAFCDLGLWYSSSGDSNIGASKLLQVMHQEYDLVMSGDDLSKYKCIVIPDHAGFTDEDKAALLSYANGGGKIVTSYDSVFDELGIVKIEPSTCDKDFIECELEECSTPFLSYCSAYKVRSDGEVLARVYEPYFNRTYRHFCGHKNTPNKTEPADYPALVEKGNVIYFAHPIFKAYNDSGSYLLEQYIIKAIKRVYDPAIKTEGLPSCGRVRLRRSTDGDFFALHVLYAPPVNRGNVCLLCDFPTLHGVSFTVRVDEKIREVVTAPDGEAIPFVQKGNELSFTLPPFSLHKLVIFKK